MEVKGNICSKPLRRKFKIFKTFLYIFKISNRNSIFSKLKSIIRTRVTFFKIQIRERVYCNVMAHIFSSEIFPQLRGQE